MSQKNTLFNYFAKTPSPAVTKPKIPKSADKPEKKSSDESSPDKDKENKIVNTPKPEKKPASRKRILVQEDSEDEDELESKKPKEYDIPSEDSGDEFVPEGEASESDGGVSEGASEDDPSSQEEEESPVKKRKRPVKKEKPNKRAHVTTPKARPSKAPGSTSKPVLTTPSRSQDSQASGEEGANWSFLKFDFLKPEKIRDRNRRRPSDPDYDPRTLHVPDDFMRNQTPGHRQWWEIKSKHYDCILFFKVGKFYELYHMDAVTGVGELSLTFMRGEYAHCGFPEIAYGRFSATLVDKGYKVARIEQTETPDMMTERCKKQGKTSKFDKVVAREICQITTKGTRIFTIVEGESKEASSKYLLAFVEKDTNGRPTYGVCFVDTTIGEFRIGQFVDDRHSSRLRTLIAKYPPCQVVYERNRLSKQTEVILNTSLASTYKEALAPESEFWSASTTLLRIAENNYFGDKGMPESLKTFVGEGDSVLMSATEDSELGVRALGAVVWCLSQSMIDYQLLSMANFEVYVPIDGDSPPTQIQELSSRYMILDAVTLRNLNVVESLSGSIEGTLIQKLDHCCTPFGKRLLRQWLCAPLTSIQSIESRQRAISALRDNPHVIKEARQVLAKVPDLERLLFRIHAQSSKGQPESHPDNRAILFEEKTYSKRKIMEFITVLNGFQVLQDFAKMIQDSEVAQESGILKTCSHFPDKGSFPNLEEHLNFFRNAFDHEEAEKEGKILPSLGVDTEYDAAMDTLKDIEGELKTYLKSQCDHFGCKVVYVGSDKKRFQLEVAEGPSKKAGSGYEFVGQRKGYKRFSTSETKELLEKQMQAEDVRTNVLLNLRKRIFSRFSERYADWSAAVECVAVLDVLMSLAEYSLNIDGDVCVPVFKQETVFVNVKNGKYPCFTGEDKFIPNDTAVGGDAPGLLLLTGPNMGGKSTLMRQLGLLIIMAQMGCHVPAASMELSPVDRIFTRIGANDDIMAGESTFYLELCETSAILSHATNHSLVLIDELGRGTSTYDGTAIAAAVLKLLCDMGSRTIFSTHYHSLVEDFKDNKQVYLGHMACMAETEEDDEGTQETVTFLYKLAPGACPKSYGFNAARLAGVPSQITRLGSLRAKQLETETVNRKLFRALFTRNNLKEIIASF